ncbi:MAG: cupin domain-containing protein [Actinobacteria bacterium]|nr:cupin domain-containing protein [Actinomycetota bacterium]
MRREHELDRQLEQWAQRLEDLPGRHALVRPVGRELEAVAAVDERIAGDERPAARDPKHEVVRLHPRERLDADPQPVADDFEGWRQLEQLGVNPFVLGPGAMAMYHWEADQEDFLVVSGETVLIIEGEERQLRAWDFVHCPLNTKHVIVGAGNAPCLVIAVGARTHDGEPDSLGFTVDEVAKRHGASVEEDTMDGGVAYASLPPREPTAYRDGWLPE